MDFNAFLAAQATPLTEDLVPKPDIRLWMFEPFSRSEYQDFVFSGGRWNRIKDPAPPST